jgi:RNA polymerase sigma factor (sigma-70 family)
VQRYARVVWGVCRRNLHSSADAEDAFQATFLVLIRRANEVVEHPALGPWLYRVALHTVRNLRRSQRRRLDATALDHEPASMSSNSDSRLDLDAALAKLPERLRRPVLLCHLQGYTRAEAASQLGCPEGTLSANLAEALKRLRKQLGVADVADVAAVLAVAGAVTIPSDLLAATTRAAVLYSTSMVGVSPIVATLTEGVLRMIWLKKLTAAVAVVVVGFGVTLGVGLSVSADEPKKTATPETKPAGPKLDELRRRAGELETETLLNEIRRQDSELEAKIKLCEVERARLVQATAMIQRKNAERLEKIAKTSVDSLMLTVVSDDNAAWGGRYRILEVVDGKKYQFSIFDEDSMTVFIQRAVMATKSYEAAGIAPAEGSRVNGTGVQITTQTKPKRFSLQTEAGVAQKYIDAALKAFTSAKVETVSVQITAHDSRGTMIHDNVNPAKVLTAISNSSPPPTAPAKK